MSAVADDGHKFACRPLSEAIGSEVLSADLKALLGDGVRSRLRGAFAGYRLFLVCDEHISAANQLNFAKEFWR